MAVSPHSEWNHKVLESLSIRFKGLPISNEDPGNLVYLVRKHQP